MTRRTFSVLLVIGVAGLVIWWIRPDRDTDHAPQKDWFYYGHLADNLRSLEHRIPWKILTVPIDRLEQACNRRSFAEMNALIRSGYLVSLQFPVNTTNRHEEILREWFNLPHHDERDGGLRGDNGSNLVTIICRPKYAPVYSNLFQWRSETSSLALRAEAATRLVPMGTKQWDVEQVLGNPSRRTHFLAPPSADPAYASLTNTLDLPAGVSKKDDAQNIWCEYYDFPGGDYVCVAFDAKVFRWEDRPLIRVWYGRTNDAQIHFPTQGH